MLCEILCTKSLPILPTASENYRLLFPKLHFRVDILEILQCETNIVILGHLTVAPEISILIVCVAGKVTEGSINFQ